MGGMRSQALGGRGGFSEVTQQLSRGAVTRTQDLSDPSEPLPQSLVLGLDSDC